MLIIGIAGGSGAGKTTFVKDLIEKVSKVDVVLMPLDMYYKDNSHIPPEKRKDINYDHPDSIDFDLLLQHLKTMEEGKSVEMPTYSYSLGKRLPETIKIFPKSVVIIEGILTLANDDLKKFLDIKIFIDSDPDVRLMNILQRDVYERERTFPEVLKRYESTVKPMHVKYINPTRVYADFIIPPGISKEISSNFVVTMIQNHLLRKMK